MESAWERCSESPKRSARVTHLVRIPESLPRGIHRGGGVPAGHSPLELPGGQHRAANCDADAPNPRAEADQGGWFIVTQRIFPDDDWQTVSLSANGDERWTRQPEARTSIARKTNPPLVKKNHPLKKRV